MNKKYFRNSALYLLFFANLVYAVRNGFSWLFYVSAILTAAVFIMDLAEVLKHGK